MKVVDQLKLTFLIAYLVEWSADALTTILGVGYLGYMEVGKFAVATRGIAAPTEVDCVLLAYWGLGRKPYRKTQLLMMTTIAVIIGTAHAIAAIHNALIYLGDLH